ncbi:hypothetical protein C0J52_04183 [Blattella germanica]|nr:hypothetical protein C0J52_04183 [Blattella germanica]
MGPPCHCKANCRELINGKEALIFHAFWDMGDYNAQNAYLFGCIKAQATKRRYPKKRTHPDDSRRSFSYMYQVKVDGVEVTVCRDEFVALHGLQNSRGRLQHIQKMITNVGVVKSDGRGKHNNQPRKYAEKDIENVHEYINSIPKYQSHYSRSLTPNKKYLNCDLTIEDTYRLYVTWSNEKGVKAVSSDKYRRIFCSDFNIGFKILKSDTCKFCDALQITLATIHSSGKEEEVEKVELQHKLHNLKA